MLKVSYFIVAYSELNLSWEKEYDRDKMVLILDFCLFLLPGVLHSKIQSNIVKIDNYNLKINYFLDGFAIKTQTKNEMYILKASYIWITFRYSS